MRLSEFWRRMERRFGSAYADSVATDQVIARLGGRTVRDALTAGVAPAEVWRAVCETFEVPARDR